MRKRQDLRALPFMTEGSQRQDRRADCLTEEQQAQIKANRDAALTRKENNKEVSCLGGVDIVEQQAKIKANRDAALIRKGRGQQVSGLGDMDIVEDLDDNAILEPPTKRNLKRVASSNSLLAGPSSLEDTFQWADANWVALKFYAGPHGVDYAATIEKNLCDDKDPQVISTTCAGTGGAEVAANIIGSTVKKLSSSCLARGCAVVVWSSCDISHTSQHMLANHIPGSRARHRFGTVCDRVPPTELAKLRAIEDKHLTKFSDLKQQLKDNTMTKDMFGHRKAILGDDYVKALTAVLSTVTFLDEVQCFECNKLCPVSPRHDPRFRNSRWTEVAGTTCDPWSKVGSHGCFLSPATLPEYVWAFSCRFYELDDIIHECTVNFQPHTLLAALNPPPSDQMSLCDEGVPKHYLARPVERGESPDRCYKMLAMKFGPVELGIPSSGERSWVWFFLSGVIRFQVAPSAPLFKDIFYRPRMLDASIYNVVPDSTLLLHRQLACAKNDQKTEKPKGP